MLFSLYTNCSSISNKLCWNFLWTFALIYCPNMPSNACIGILAHRYSSIFSGGLTFACGSTIFPRRVGKQSHCQIFLFLRVDNHHRTSTTLCPAKQKSYRTTNGFEIEHSADSKETKSTIRSRQRHHNSKFKINGELWCRQTGTVGIWPKSQN